MCNVGIVPMTQWRRSRGSTGSLFRRYTAGTLDPGCIVALHRLYHYDLDSTVAVAVWDEY